MQYNPQEPTRRGSEQGAGGAGGSFSQSGSDRLNANLGDTTGDRSASAFSDTSGTLGRESLEGGQGRFEEAAGQAKETAGRMKERAMTLKATLADKLEAGAERIRQRSHRADMTEVADQAGSKAYKASDKLAAGMESTADWLRNADMASVRSGIENQVRAKPGRTLLIALGVGYLVGRAFRGTRQG